MRPSLEKKLGTELSKSTLSLSLQISSTKSHLDGPTMGTLVLKDPTTARSVLMLPSVVLSLTLTTKLVSTLVSKSQAPTPRSCLANGSIKLVLARVSRSVTTSGYRATFLVVSLKTTVALFPWLQSCSLTGTALVATPTSQPRPCVMANLA